MLKKCCPWLFGASDANETPQDKEQKKGLLTDEESNAVSQDTTAPAQPGAAPATAAPSNGPASEYEEEMEQLSNIVALMLAEAIFAYESSFEIKLSDQFAMMFDMQLSFSFASLKEAEKQLMNALAEIFDNQAASKWFFEQLDEQMVAYVDGLTPPQKWEYKSRSGFGRPEKLRVVLEGADAPQRTGDDTVKILVQYSDHTCGRNDPFKFEVQLMRYGIVSGHSDDVAAMKRKKEAQ